MDQVNEVVLLVSSWTKIGHSHHNAEDMIACGGLQSLDNQTIDELNLILQAHTRRVKKKLIYAPSYLESISDWFSLLDTYASFTYQRLMQAQTTISDTSWQFYLNAMADQMHLCFEVVQVLDQTEDHTARLFMLYYSQQLLENIADFYDSSGPLNLFNQDIYALHLLVEQIIGEGIAYQLQKIAEQVHLQCKSLLSKEDKKQFYRHQKMSHALKQLAERTFVRFHNDQVSQEQSSRSPGIV